MDLEFLQSMDAQIIAAVAVAVLAIVLGAVFLFSSKKPKGSLDPENFKEFKLIKCHQLSHNVAKFTFELPTPTSVLGLPIGQHISCRGKDSQGEEEECHTISERCVGEYLAVKGPKVARAILENPKDMTNIHLIYANVTYEDILLKEELDSLVAKYPDRFNVYYVLNQPPEVWNGGVGFVSKEMIQTNCPAPALDIQILRCGPPPMNKAMAANLEGLGYSPEMLFQFWSISDVVVFFIGRDQIKALCCGTF